MCPNISHSTVRKSQVGHFSLEVKFKVNVMELMNQHNGLLLFFFFFFPVKTKVYLSVFICLCFDAQKKEERVTTFSLPFSKVIRVALRFWKACV